MEPTRESNGDANDWAEPPPGVDRVCTVDRTPERLRIQGSVESMPPSWTYGLLYVAGFVAVAGALAYIGYVVFVVGDPAGFGLDRRGFSTPENDTWLGVLIAGPLISTVTAGFLFVGLGLIAKKLPGASQELVYRLEIGDGRARVERRVGGDTGDIVHEAEMPLEELQRVERGSQYGGLVSVINLVGRGGRTIDFGKYIQKDTFQDVSEGDVSNDPEEMMQTKQGADAEYDRLIGEIDDYLRNHTSHTMETA